MKPKFKVGDIVHIVDKLKDNMPQGVAFEMIKFQEKAVTIVKVIPDSVNCDKEFESVFDGATYRINEDGGTWSWTSPMFKEAYNKKTYTPIFKPKTFVTKTTSINDFLKHD